MADDAIGIVVLEELSAKLEELDIDIIISETDAFFALSQIDDGDFMLIMDATCLGHPPGFITVTPLHELENVTSYTQHEQSVLTLLPIYKNNVTGYMIGIEVHEIVYQFGVSEPLKKLLPKIVEQVFLKIKELIGGI